jgi:hypothetical protein
VAFPIVSGPNGLQDGIRDGGWGHEGKPEENHAAGRGKISVNDQGLEVCVEGEYDAVLLLSDVQKNLIICAGMSRLCPGDVMVVLPEFCYDVTGHVLISEDTHQSVEVVLTG